MWTLEHNGTERSLADWGLGTDLQLERISQAADVCTVNQAAEFETSVAWSYGDAVIVRRDRAGSGTSWSGGSVWFRGRTGLVEREASGQGESLRHVFNGPWFDFQQLVFRQSRNVFETALPVVPALTTEVWLGHLVNGSPLNTGGQITEAVNWAIACGVSVQIGTIDPAVNIVTYNARDLTVAEVIVQMLRFSPDVVTWFDYTTSPPTFHARKLSNLTAATLTVGTDKFTTVNLRPRPDLQLPAVYLIFLTQSDVDGTLYVHRNIQQYPPAATGNELGAMVATIELAGSSLSHVTAELVCDPVQATSATWWKKKVPWLTNPFIKPSELTIQYLSTKDEAGNDVSLVTYPNELVDGQIAEWMDFADESVVIKAKVTYSVYHRVNSESAPTTWTTKLYTATKEISCRLRVTDATTGSYEAVRSWVEAEAEPSGLAQSIYESHATLQYEGRVDIVGDELKTGIGMGYKLNVAGTGLTLENLLIQRVVERPAWGKTEITVGPSPQLSAGDLIELLRVNRYRRFYNMPSVRETGKAAGGGDVQFGSALPRENSTSGATRPSALAATEDSSTWTKFAGMDATAHKLVLDWRTATTGSRDTAKPSVELDPALLVGTNKAMAIREFRFKDADDGCKVKRVYLLCTAPEVV